jgi:hypothetical protein
MTTKITPINVDTLLDDIDMEEYKTVLKQTLLNDDLHANIKKGLENKELVKHFIAPRFRNIQEVDNFSNILEECVEELLESEKYRFTINIEAQQDGYNIKIGISPK